MNKNLNKSFGILIAFGAIFFSLFFEKSFISADYVDPQTQLTLSGLTNGLLSYRPLDTNAYDYSTHANNGNVSGAIQTGGKLDGAYIFRGSGRTDTINVPNSGSLNPTTGLSVQAWVKWSINPSSGQYRSSILNKNANSQYRLQHNQYNSAFEFAIQTSKNSYVQSTTRPQINIWYHVIGTYDGALIKIYINGILENTLIATGSISTSVSQITIGKMINSERYFNGNIDEVALWNRPLSTKEIQALYNSGYGNRVLQRNYVLSYNATSNGNISGNYFQQINQNSNGSSVTAVPDPGYHFVQWSDGSTQNPRIDTNVIGDISVSAMFYENPPVLAQGILGYRPLDADTHDYSTNTNNGIANGATQIGGKLNGAYVFNGQTDYINVPNSSSLNPTSGLTVQAWVKWKISPTSGFNRSSLVNKNGDGQYRLQHNYSNSAFEFAIQTSKGSYRVISTTKPEINTWYQVVGTYDGILLRIYVNGILENTLPASGPLMTSTSPLSIGRRSNLNDRYFNGSIDEVILWNRPLSNIETQALYNSGNGSLILSNAYNLLYTSMPNGIITGNFFQQISKGDNGTSVTAIPNQGYHFVQWSDGSTQNPRTDTNVIGNISVYPLFNKTDTTHSLMYNAGTNGGIFGHANQLIISGSNGTQVTAIPNNGYNFVQWSDGSTQNPRIDINVKTDISVTAKFSQIISKYSIMYIAGINGSISGDTSQEILSGSNSIQVTVIPNSGYHFVQRSDGSIQNPRIDTNVIGNIVVSAQYAKNIPVYVLNYIALPYGTFSGSTYQSVSGGMNGTAILAIANQGYHFVQRSDGSIQNPRTDTNIIGNISVYALYNETNSTHSLIYDAGKYGSLYGNTKQLILSGQNGTLINVFPNPGYHFVQRSDGSIQNPRTDTNVTGDIVVSAQYAKNLQTFTLSYSHDNYGGIYGNDYQNIISGADGTSVTATPNIGYHFVQWSDGSTQNPRADTNVVRDISVTAKFNIDYFDIIYLPNVNSKSDMDLALSASGYSATGLSSIRNELNGFLVGNKKISTRDSKGKILSSIIIQSPSPTNKIEIQIPAGTIVKDTTNNNFTGVIMLPEIIPNISVPLQNVVYAATLGNTGGNIEFKDQNNNPVSVTIRMPAPGNTSGDIVDVHYSTDNGITWYLHKNTKVSLIGGEPYVEFTTDHFTDFAVTLPGGGGEFTGSFVINNDDASTNSNSVSLNISTTPEATHMRFSDDGSSRSSRETYAITKAWTLPGTYGTKTVYVQFDANGDTTSDAQTSDTIEYTSGTTCVGGGVGEACLSLEITAVTGECRYGINLDLGNHDQTYSAFTMTGIFTGNNNTYPLRRSCNDSAGKGPWNMQISSTNLIAGSYSIPNTAIELKTAALTKYRGGSSYAGLIGAFSARGTDLSTPRKVFEKTSAAGTAGEIGTDTVDLRVLVPVNQEVGAYQATITIAYPQM